MREVAAKKTGKGHSIENYLWQTNQLLSPDTLVCWLILECFRRRGLPEAEDGGVDGVSRRRGRRRLSDAGEVRAFLYISVENLSQGSRKLSFRLVCQGTAVKQICQVLKVFFPVWKCARRTALGMR